MGYPRRNHDRRNCISMITEIIELMLENDKKLCLTIYKYQSLSNFFTIGLLKLDNEEILRFLKFLLHHSATYSIELYQQIQNILFNTLWSIAISSPNQHAMYWVLARDASENIMQAVHFTIDVQEVNSELNPNDEEKYMEYRKNILQEIQNILEERTVMLFTTIKSTYPQNSAQEIKLSELILTMKFFLNSAPKFRSNRVSITELYLELRDKCLFTSLIDENKEPKCRSMKAVQFAFLLLESLLANSKLLNDLCTFLSKYHLEAAWRKRTYSSWRISSGRDLDNVDYNGLKNLGCSKKFFVLQHLTRVN